MIEQPGAAFDLRVSVKNEKPVREDGDFVLYWMIAQRRTHYNFALERAVAWAKELDKPLIVFEPLRVGYPWASDRLHAFIIAGMADHQAHFDDTPVHYYPYVEPRAGAGKGLLAALAKRAALVVTDEFPCFFIPHMVDTAAAHLSVRLEQVDSNGLLPMAATDRVFTTAHSFRAFLQKTLLSHLLNTPRRDPLAGRELRRATLPRTIAQKWPVASSALLRLEPNALARLPIDHDVRVASLPGGDRAARRRLAQFIRTKIADYGRERSSPEADKTSKLSPYLHFGHISAHEIFEEVMRTEGWTPKDVGGSTRGSKTGFWRVSEAAEGFLDELVTWRELGFNMCHKRADYTDYDSLPEWAKKTLAKHAKDPRPHRYTRAQLEAGKTHDPIWNAAQLQMVKEGWVHNHLRMLWGKKILEWSASPKQALSTMVEFMGKYSLDGRNPNSWSGFFWVLGRYDRAWGPERPIFGTVRYMSSESLARKVPIKRYVAEYAGDGISAGKR